MMSTDTKVKRAWENRGSPLVGSAHRLQKSATIVFSRNLHSKGFGGGVPLNPSTGSGLTLSEARSAKSKGNTETAAVKPRVGIE